MPNRKKQKMNKDEKERRKKLSHSQKPATERHCNFSWDRKTDGKFTDMRMKQKNTSFDQLRTKYKNMKILQKYLGCELEPLIE